MKWWKIILICISVLIIICTAWWYFYRVSPVEEGFQAASLRIENSTTLHPTSIKSQDTGSSYMLFDPSAAYLQAQIYEIEYADPLATLAATESNFTQNVLPELLDTYAYAVKVGGPNSPGDKQSVDIYYVNSATAHSEISQDMYRQILNYNKDDLNTEKINKFYSLRDEDFMKTYNFSNKFNNHPMAFIFGNMNSDLNINCAKLKQKMGASTNKNNPYLKIGFYGTSTSTIKIGLYGTGTGTDVSVGNQLANYNSNQNMTTSFRDYIYQKYFFDRDVNSNLVKSSEGAYGRSAGLPKINSLTGNQIWVSKYILYNATSGDGTTKVCASIPNEVNHNISTTILTNPTSWNLQSFMSNSASTYPIVSTLIGNFKASKPNLLYKSVPVTGTISDLNKTEIRDSVLYSMYFNFTDTNTTENQIRISSDPPCKLYMSPDCSGMSEFMFYNGSLLRLDGTGIASSLPNAIENNRIHCNEEITDNILKVLPYHTRNYIKRWALSRRERVIKYISENKCKPAKDAMDAWYVEPLCHIEDNGYACHSKTLQYRDYFNLIPQNADYDQEYINKLSTIASYCCASVYPNEQNYYKTYTRDGITCENMGSISYPYSRIIRRSYNEAKGDTTNGQSGTNDIAPYLDLMSAPTVDPNIYMTKTTNPVNPTLTLDTRSEVPGTYNITLIIQAGINFVQQPNLQVEVASYTNTKNYFNASIKSYDSASGTIQLYKISYDSISKNSTYNNPAALPKNSQNNIIYPTSYTPYDTSDIYTISYTDTSEISQTSTNSNTVYAEQISPTIGNNLTLNISVSEISKFSSGNKVIVSNVSAAENNFTGTITNVTNTGVTTRLAINPISITTSSDFSKAVTYSITLDTGTNSYGGRYWLTAAEKCQILNKIGQAYYNLLNGTNRINTFLDVYQVGDTIFDVRFQNLEQDANRVLTIQNNMSSLRANYIQYRSYNLAENELQQLDQSYLQNMINLNKQLDGSIQGISTDCGTFAYYIKIQRTNTNTTGIKLSQVVIIDNTGNNAAYGSIVQASSTKVYDHEKPPIWTQIKNSVSIDYTGTIKDSAGNSLSRINTCWPLTTTSAPYKSANCSTINGVINIKRVVDSSDQSIQVKESMFKRNQSLVDGDFKTLRVQPNYYISNSTSNNEYVTISLGRSIDIIKVILYFPLSYTETSTYSITLLDAVKNEIPIPEGIINYSSTIVPETSTEPAHMVISFMKTATRDPSLPICPTGLVNPYKVARFYTSSIQTIQRGNPTENITNLRVTGFSMGVDAALTFNPKYNAGFILNLGAGSGNTSYSPIINYNLNGSGTATNKFMIDISTQCSDSAGVINILKDYVTNLQNIDFTNREDIKALGYDTRTYSYRPSSIIGASYTNATSTCNIRWYDTMVDRATNQHGQTPIERYGKFVYANNNDNWGAINSYYDIPNSRIYANTDSSKPSVTSYGSPISIPDILPEEAESLDTLGGSCPPRKCSDINVITQLIRKYNNAHISTPILRVTKAFTANSKQCDFECLHKQTDGSTQKKNISITLDVSITKNEGESMLDSDTYDCKYIYKNMYTSTQLDDNGNYGGQYIQSNTPLLSYVFNYVTEIMTPYVDNIATTTQSLIGLYTKSGAINTLRNYREDTYGAYGQIQELAGCPPTYINTGKNSCSDASIQNEFVRYYKTNNLGNPISQIINIGTASETQCDFVITTGGINGIDYTDTTRPPKLTLGNNGQTIGYRASMLKNENRCEFTISSITNYTPSITDTNIKNMKININSALNQSAWKTPVTLGTLKTKQNISLSAASFSLIVPRSNSYSKGINVLIVDKADIRNRLNATIDSYTAGTNTATLVFNNIKNVTGNFSNGSIYTIQEVPPTFNSIISDNGIEMEDFIDCRAPGSSGAYNTGPKTCGSTQSASFNLINLPAQATSYGAPVGTMNITKMAILYPGAVDIKSYNNSSDTWDVRITPSDNLRFEDTFKRIQVGSINGVNRIKATPISADPATSPYSFFTINPISDSVLATCANLARTKWNTDYYVATNLMNKKIMGTISYYSKINNNVLVFKATKCEFGIHGPLDIRVDPVDTYFRVEYRQTISPTSPQIVVSVHEIIPMVEPSLTSYINVYNAEAPYNIRTLNESMKLTHIYRSLRFTIKEIPSSSSLSYASAVLPTYYSSEISVINFYKTSNSTRTTAVNKSDLKEVELTYATYSVDGLNPPKIAIYKKPPFGMTTESVIISPSINSSLTITIVLPSPPYEPEFSVNDKLLVYNYGDNNTYFRGILTAIIDNKLTINVTEVRGTSYTIKSLYAVVKNMCDSGFSPYPDTQKISFEICIQDNIPSYTMNNNNITIPGLPNSQKLPCAIGFEKDATNEKKCNLTANFSAVNSPPTILNPLTPRLKLNFNQSLIINMNNNEKVDYFTFNTGASNFRPTKWLIEGSIDGNRWITLHNQTNSYQYTNNTKTITNPTTGNTIKVYSFIQTDYFPLDPVLGGAALTNPFSGSYNMYNFDRDPSISSGTTETTIISEPFANPTILDTPSEPKFRRKVPTLNNSYTLPLTPTKNVSPLQIYMPIQQQSERRIQYLRLKILDTRSESQTVHMSDFKIITSLGPLPTKYYKITNPMGIHPSSKHGPDALSDINSYWISANRQPLLIKFSSLPAISLYGFQFSIPQISNPFPSVPSEWIMEGSYDGRIWEIYNEVYTPSIFSGYVSPVYKFKKEL